MNETKNKYWLSACGVYCEACYSYIKGTCKGCLCEDKKQKRTSKWSCDIRNCAKEKNLTFCGECEEFVCKTFKKRLLYGHKNDPRFAYRFETIENFDLLNSEGEETLHQKLKDQHTCTECGDVVVFYEYRCLGCGVEQTH